MSFKEIIRAEGLRKSFKDKVVLDHVNLEIFEGKSHAILGPSGAGKSVLVKCILGLLSFDDGKVSWRGSALNKRSKMEERGSFSYVFQFGGLLDSFNLLENVIFPVVRKRLKTRKEALLEALNVCEQLGILDYVERLPKEVPLSIRKLGAVARSVVVDAEVIFLDEPDTGLDPQATYNFYTVINQHFRSKNKTLVVISHDVPEVLSVCDRYALIYQGRIVAEGEIKDGQVLKANDYIIQFLKGGTDGPIRLG